MIEKLWEAIKGAVETLKELVMPPPQPVPIPVRVRTPGRRTR